jgi:cardiolipin synthase A/B
LMEAAARGIQVTVVYDALGSWKMRRVFHQKLRAGGVKIRAFNPFSLRSGFKKFLRRDHRKLLLVDGSVAYVGGLNIAAQWAPKGEGNGGGWRDDVVRIEGPAVSLLERRFCATWRVVINERLRRWWKPRENPRAEIKGDVSLAVLSSRRGIHSAYVHALEQARSSILMAAGYFVPDRKILKALKAAAARGVEVSLVLSGSSDHPAVQFASRALYGRLLRWGVKIYEWKGVLHSKTAVVDGIWGTLGSFNLEPWSLSWNHEMNVVFADAGLGALVERSVREDLRQSTPISLEVWQNRSWWRRGMERLFSLLRRMF